MTEALGQQRGSAAVLLHAATDCSDVAVDVARSWSLALRLTGNAAASEAGLEEMKPRCSASQIETTLSARSTSSAPPCGRCAPQRSGLVVTISSTAGIALAGDPLTAYAASKSCVEGFMEAWPPSRPLRDPRDAGRTGFSAPSCSARSPRSTPSSIAPTTPTAPGPRSRPGRAWTANRAAIPPTRRRPVHPAAMDEPPLRFAAAPTPSNCSSPSPTCATQAAHTATCPGASPMTTAYRGHEAAKKASARNRHAQGATRSLVNGCRSGRTSWDRKFAPE